MQKIKVLDPSAIRQDDSGLFVEFDESPLNTRVARMRTLLKVRVPEIYRDAAREAVVTGRRIEVTCYRSPDGWVMDWLRLA